MSVIRQDPTTKEWVIMAAERMRRPYEYKTLVAGRRHITPGGFCPFCPGHEASTPEELFRITDFRGTGWTVRVTSNKFPAVGPTGRLERREEGPVFREFDGVGAHEVIV